jgi:outer membrane protein assembly factor BamB
MSTKSLLLAAWLGCLAGTAPAALDWPEFRGPAGNGCVTNPLPLTWSEQQNIRWKTPIHGRGWSSPVIGEGRVWLTTANEAGTELSALCLDQGTGRVVHDLKLFTVEKPQGAHKFNTYASPSPALEAGRVYVTFGSPGTACLESRTGRVLWQRRDLECNHLRGAGSSPILYRHLLILHFDGTDQQYVVALDKLTGQTVWKTPRSIDYKDLRSDGRPESDGDFRKSFATPTVAQIDGQPVLISQGAKAVYAYQPDNGKELWRVEERSSHSASSRPVYGLGLIFCQTGWSTGELLALSPGQPGEVIDANTPDAGRQLKVVWQSKRNVPRKPGLLWVNDLIFTMDDGGIASCLNALTGEAYWRERVGGNHSASPLAANGRVYFFSEEGTATVVGADRTFKVLAENRLADGFMASPAVAGRALFLRTRSHVYRVEDPGQ